MLFRSAGIFLVLIIAGLSIFAFISKRKSNKLLAKQFDEINLKNLVIQEKNKDITDSIQYAKRIQEAILPSHHFVNQLLPQSFILFKPKDIVSGDFYWTAHWGDHYLFAAVDCTGHGVPGAFMSIVGQNLLNQADRKSTRLNSSHIPLSRMPSSA